MVNGVNKIYVNINWELKVENWGVDECILLSASSTASARARMFASNFYPPPRTPFKIVNGEL